jgi:hypothetical protein
MSYSKEYATWRRIINRTTNPDFPAYSWYGGKGVSVCPEWRGRFEAFYDHIGPAPSLAHSIDRINPFGNYEPGNVRWATAKEQANNKRVHHCNGK